MKLLEKNFIKYTFLYTEQHKETIDGLINNFQIKTPYHKIINQKNEAKSIKLFTGWGFRMLIKLINPFSRKNVLTNGRGLILTHGDTATTAWAAIYGKTSFCRVMHIESGLRSFNLLNPFPEEIMRLITFAFSDYFVCPNEWAMHNLRYYPGKKINVRANTMYDSLMYAIEQININKNKEMKEKINSFDLPEKFCLVSIHRSENIFNNNQLAKVIEILISISAQIDLVIILHPVTKEHLIKTGYIKQLDGNKKIHLIDRQDFFTFVAVAQKAQFIVTDGGSNQEEMSYIGKPTLIMRSTTERTEGLSKNIVLSKFNKDIIEEFVHNYKKYKTNPEKNKFSPSKQIVQFIKELTVN